MTIAPLLLALSLLAEPATAASLRPGHQKLAVLGFRALEVEFSLAALLSEVALTEAGRFKALEVLGDSDIATMLGHERQQLLLGCREDSACMAQLAGAMGADYLLVGSVGRVGTSNRIDLKLIEVRKAQVLGRSGETLAGPPERIIAAVQGRVLELLRPLAGEPAPARSGGADFDGRYTGVITCDNLPGQKTVPLRTRLSIKIVNSQAEYEREVYRPDTSGPSGVFERGTGRVSPRGELPLSATVAGRGWDYQASYSGLLEGGTARLAGQQVWHLGRRPAATRPCTIVVTRSELKEPGGERPGR
jgi:TolB-like protein